MQVVKVLNNSLVLALDDEGQETILMGKGIGFHKATGYRFRPEEVEKVYLLKDRDIRRSVIRLAAEVGSIYFELAKAITDYAQDTFGMTLMDHIYLALTDHIAFAVRRVRESIIIPNFYTQDMRQFNPEEYQVGRYALKLIQEQCGVTLPEDEAGSIAFHFINAQIDHPYGEKNRKIRSVTEDILQIVQYYYRIEYNEKSVSFSRYVTHVRLLAQRLVSGQQLPEDKSPLLFEQVAAVCRSELLCAERVSLYAKEKFGVPLTNQESLYLVLHIHRILEDIPDKPKN